jgi:hypothetical protein
MINGLSEAFVAIQGWLLDRLIQPPLLAMGLGSYLEMAFDGIEFFLCGVLQIGAAYLLLRPLEALRPIEVWPDRRAVRVDVLYSLLDRLGIIPSSSLPCWRPCSRASTAGYASTTSSHHNSKTSSLRWRRGHCSVS